MLFADRNVAFLTSRFPSHVYSSLGLARRLQGLGFGVVYWGEASIRALVEGQGFCWRPLAPLFCYYEPVMREGPRAAWQRRRTLPKALDEFERSLDLVLSQQRPEFVLVDPMSVAYVPLLHARGCRCVLLQDKPCSVSDPLVPPPNSGCLPPTSFAGRCQVKLRWWLEHGLIGARDLANASLRALGLYTCDQLLPMVLARARNAPVGWAARRRVRYELSLNGLPEWVLGTPEMDFARSSNHSSAHIQYIGPCTDLQRDEIPGRYGRGRSADSRLIYVAMGTDTVRANRDGTLLRRMVAALQSIANVEIVVSTGNAHTWAALRRRVPAVRVAPFLPQISLLKRAHLAITHAGANTFRECIATSTPMLAYPREFDQHGNAARIVHLGIGLRGSRTWDTAAAIRRKALTILNDRGFTDRVRKLNESVRQQEEDLLRRAVASIMGT